MPDPIDVLMWVGEEHYTVDSFIKEAQRMGVSKRISRSSIPEGIVPGTSRLLIKHRAAITHAKDLRSLAMILQSLGVLNWKPEAPEYLESIPAVILDITRALDVLKEEKYGTWLDLVENHEITWSPGVIGYTYITSIQYVAHDHEEELPEDLAHLEGYVEPIRVEYDAS